MGIEGRNIAKNDCSSSGIGSSGHSIGNSTVWERQCGSGRVGTALAMYLKLNCKIEAGAGKRGGRGVGGYARLGLALVAAPTRLHIKLTAARPRPTPPRSIKKVVTMKIL